MDSDRYLDAQADILHALGWDSDWSRGQTHTLDDLIEWHRVANGEGSAVHAGVVAIIPELIERHAELRALAGDGYEHLRKTIGVATIDRADDEGGITTGVLRLPYRYENNDRFYAYMHRLSRGKRNFFTHSRDTLWERECITALGDEDLRLLDLCYDLNVKPRDAANPDLYGKGTRAEWRIRALSHKPHLHDHVLWDAEAQAIEPTGIYLTHFAENVFYNDQVPTLIEYKKCRVAGISHAGAVELLALGVEDPVSIIELCREVGEEYGLAAARSIA